MSTSQTRQSSGRTTSARSHAQSRLNFMYRNSVPSTVCVSSLHVMAPLSVALHTIPAKCVMSLPMTMPVSHRSDIQMQLTWSGSPATWTIACVASGTSSTASGFFVAGPCATLRRMSVPNGKPSALPSNTLLGIRSAAAERAAAVMPGCWRSYSSSRPSWIAVRHRLFRPSTRLWAAFSCRRSLLKLSSTMCVPGSMRTCACTGVATSLGTPRKPTSARLTRSSQQ
mmetsp:Transcript_56601/g.181739  ORF Transcript_56601/g.181739 Transcript_56601/m.181739 type:complete len:226 (-) Transcript_56601:91-768(-)